MKTDEATSEESFAEKMGRAKNIFDTPTKRYLDTKKAFLKNALRRKFWGANKSKQRVVAVNELLEYCKKSIELTDECGDRELTHADTQGVGRHLQPCCAGGDLADTWLCKKRYQ